MSRKVIDTNCIRSPTLRAFLAASKANYAVLTDYASMEVYKDTPATLYRSMEVLGDYPDQVIVLKTTAEICGLNARSSGLQSRLIDYAQTNQFAKYCRQMNEAQAGDVLLQRQLSRLRTEANSHLDQVMADVRNLPSTVNEVARLYSQSELHALRTRGHLSPKAIDKLIGSVLSLAAHLFVSHPKVRTPPSFDELEHTYIFRMALCVLLWCLDRISHGSVYPRPDRLRNDMVDMHFVAIATFFDGFMTEDKMSREIYHQTVAILQGIAESRKS